MRRLLSVIEQAAKLIGAISYRLLSLFSLFPLPWRSDSILLTGMAFTMWFWCHNS